MTQTTFPKLILSFQRRDRRQWEVPWNTEIHRLLDACRVDRNFAVTEDPSAADAHLTFDTCMGGGRSRPPDNDFPQVPLRAVVNYSDFPRAFLPGAYTSLKRRQFDPEIHLSWPHWQLPNPFVNSIQEPAAPNETEWLFSYEGAVSHAFRQKFVGYFEHRKGPWRVRNATVDYGEHGEQHFRSYVERVAKSQFVICPRGAAPYSHRILEVMALGRVPVVLADDWIPFSIPEDGYFVQVRESDFHRMPEILGKIRDYAGIQRASTEVYRKYFSHHKRLTMMVSRLVGLMQENPTPFQQLSIRKRWQGWAFRRSNKLHLDQRIAGRIQEFLALRETLRLKARAKQGKRA
jgi:hypothetical protein